MCAQVPNELQCPIQYVVMGDGNTSLSRLPHRFESDTRIFGSDYFLTHEEVDRFAKVQKHSRNNVSILFPSSLFSCNIPQNNTSELPPACLEWKNSKPMPSKSKAGSLKVMDETGIFSVICRHGIVQLVMDMVQSGEL